jgi:hypothetical protein
MATHKAFTQEWLDAWKQKIAGSQEYKEIAKEWEGRSLKKYPQPRLPFYRLLARRCP